MGLDNWCTGPEVATPLYQLYKRPVGLDPCSNAVSIVEAHVRFVAGGLHLPWDAPDIYENPPYSNLLRWSQKAVAELQRPYAGLQKELIRLVPVATSTEWWAISLEADPLLIFTSRLSFLNEAGQRQSTARFDSVIMAWLNGAKQERRFLDLLGPIVRMVVRGRDWTRRT